MGVDVYTFLVLARILRYVTLSPKLQFFQKVVLHSNTTYIYKPNYPNTTQPHYNPNHDYVITTATEHELILKARQTVSCQITAQQVLQTEKTLPNRSSKNSVAAAPAPCAVPLRKKRNDKPIPATPPPPPPKQETTSCPAWMS